MKLGFKNIINSQNNITRHLTGAQKIMSQGSFIMLSAFAIMSTVLANTIPVPSTSAESFQSKETIQFNLNPTITINITGGDLRIESLSPGDTKDSNIITVNASSNATGGYNVYGSVGSTTNPSTELRKDGTSTTHIFDSITTNKPTLSDFTGNDWGYSYSTDSGTTWQSGDITGTPASGYNGLPLYTTEAPITLINSTDASTNSIQFKIGAKATSTQVAGEYTNVINFIGVANDNPNIVYMQDATLADCGKTMVDIRDNNVYSTTLVEDTCWMTTNLDLPGSTILSSDDTDFTSDYYASLPNDNGWTVVDSNKLKMPQSDVSEFNDYRKAAVYNTGNHTSNCSSGCYSYYSWATATLSSSKGYNTDSPYSLCPKGWRLPTTRIDTDNTSDFRKLIIASGGSADIFNYTTDTVPTGNEIFINLSSTPLNFLSSGHCHSGACYFGVGYYWSATTSPDNSATGDSLELRLDKVYSAAGYNRSNGYAVRCVKSS